MSPLWAKFLYRRSIGFDNSEGEFAQFRQRERLKLLHDRIGDGEMRQFLQREYSNPFYRTQRWLGQYADSHWYNGEH